MGVERTAEGGFALTEVARSTVKDYLAAMVSEALPPDSTPGVIAVYLALVKAELDALLKAPTKVLADSIWRSWNPGKALPVEGES